jgi:probable rRNA maturation factor
MLAIEIANEQQNVIIDMEQLQETVKHVLQTCNVEKGTISIAVVDDAAMRALKQRYYGKAEATDVLSFDLQEETSNPQSEQVLDCEVVVNAQRAQQASQETNQNAQAELNLYVVHGLLHQLGYNDQESRQAKIMHQKEDQLLEELGFGPVYSQGNRR